MKKLFNMNHYCLYLVLSLLLFTQCRKPAAPEEAHEGHEEEIKIVLTQYTERYEYFAEADPFVQGRECSMLAHFTRLADFKPLPEGRIALSLTVAGQTVDALAAQPVRPGVYRFKLIPKYAGQGVLLLQTADGDRIRIDDVRVYKTEEEAHADHEPQAENAQLVTFTKEKSWKVDFATSLPQSGSLGQVIKTTAQIQPAQGDEAIVTARSSGLVRFSEGQVLEGKNVSAGQRLFSISGGGLTDNNMAVRFAEARNNYHRARSEYERSRDLAKERIVSDKDLLKARNEYDNAKAVFDNLNQGVVADSQIATSPLSGFIRQVLVQNGQYVEAGQAILTVSQNRTLLLRADVRPKYAPLLASVVSAKFRTLHDNKTYTLQQLNGKILSYGQSADTGNYRIPVSVQVDNTAGLLPGGFVEIYLSTAGRHGTLSVADSAILEEQGNFYIFVQINPEQFEKREITLGVSDGLFTEVLSGLAPTERVVSRGAVWVKLAQASNTLDAHSGHVH